MIEYTVNFEITVYKYVYTDKGILYWGLVLELC